MPKSKIKFDFKPTTVLDWEKIAQQELGKKDNGQNSAKERYGLIIKPYYDANDTQEKIEIRLKRPDQNASSWHNAPKVIVINDKSANEAALSHLNSGADGVYFEIKSNVAQPDLLLRDIHLPYCAVFFTVDSNPAAYLDAFADFAKRTSEVSKVNGAFFWNDFSNQNIDWARFMSFSNFKFCGIRIHDKKNIVDEIVDSLLTAVEFIERLNQEKFSVEQAFDSLAFSISVDTDFFLAIAKIRALQNVWFTLQEAYQIKKPIAAFIHGYSKPWIDEDFQPLGNMLKQTTAAMAAAMAGCNAITVEPENSENKMMSRIARNVSSMLSEESHLSKVNDPLAGSFFVDALTDQIASEAWKKFQQR